MTKVLIIKPNDAFLPDTASLGKHHELFFAESYKDSTRIFLDNPDILFCLAAVEENRAPALRVFLEKIHTLNPMLPLILFAENITDSDRDYYKTLNKNIFLTSDIDAVADKINKDHINARSFHRINWPLKVKYFKQVNPDDCAFGLVTSLSLSGAYISTNNFNLLDAHVIFCNILFKDFNFLVEGEIVRINKNPPRKNRPAGIAIKFRNITKITTEYINEIINDKILTSLFSDLG